jgi:signal transduction histidine kinase
LIIHSLRQPESRLELRVIWVAVLLAIAPLFAVALVSLINGSSRTDGFALISFPVLPFAYLYTAYRRQFGGLEMRANRLFSAYFFVILLGTIGLPLLAVADRLLTSPDDIFIVGALSAATGIIISIWGFPPFQAFVEHRWLGIVLPSKQLPQIYSGRATSSTTIDALTNLLKNDVLPSLLIRQFLFIRLDTGLPEILLVVGIDRVELFKVPELTEFADLQANALFPIQLWTQSFSWLRLTLPLKVGDEVLGYWFFGRRDPDDLYSETEIPVLQSLADQTAIVLNSIIQTERLRAVYQADINRFEQQRLRLALDLHDSILNKMAAMLMKLDDLGLTPAFQDTYKEVIQHLREIVKDLRPALLDYGLKPAFEELADNLMERYGDAVQITILLETNGSSYGKDVEQHLFRIVQESCMNSMRHGKPKQITISGHLDSDKIQLEVSDDGIGFELGGKLNLNLLLANHHFGLAGMIERGALIGADIKIASLPKRGTLVQINWEAGKS